MFRILSLIVFITFNIAGVHAEEPRKATLYKNPQCGCCEAYGEYLRDNNFEIKVIATQDLPGIKQQYKVPKKLEGCHTLIVDNYVIEGHVPIETVNKLLTEKPKITGISLPGMPMGSPGMNGTKAAPFTIYEINEGTSKVYSVQ